jgi:hypothetical protein
LKGYTKFIVAFTFLLTVYIVAELNRPKPVDWNITLSKEDKDPYGTYILYHQLKDFFPSAQINSYRLPVYDQVNNFSRSNTAYLLIEPNLQISREDMDELLNYVVTGNYVMLSAENFSNTLMDTLKFKTMRRFDLITGDSSYIDFRNPLLRAPEKYRFNRVTIDGYFTSFDTARSVVLGTNHKDDVNFIKMPYGEGAFFIHTSPLTFSNYFILSGENAGYTAKVMSYLPRNLKLLFWDEYYKLGPSGSDNPLRFLLNDPFLKWALRIALITMLIFVLFEMKRRQRIIPQIAPLRNSTLDFVTTVGNVYFNQRDNKNIAEKKISYFLEFVRSRFFLVTTHLDEEFRQALARKSGMDRSDVDELLYLIGWVKTNGFVPDDILLSLNNKIDSFYQTAK